MLCCFLSTHLRVTVLVAESQALIEPVKHTQAAMSTSSYNFDPTMFACGRVALYLTCTGGWTQKPPPDDCCCACARCMMNFVVSRKRFAQSDRQASSLELKYRPGVPIHFSQQVAVSSEIVRCSCAFACSSCTNRCNSASPCLSPMLLCPNESLDASCCRAQP